MWFWRGGSAARTGVWWTTGDFAAHDGCRVEPLIDGHAAMLSMCAAFLSAKRSILLAAWDIRADLPLVRGEDLYLDTEAARAERGLRARLQSAGLDEEALAFWSKGRLTVADVLGFAVARGVRIGVLLWDGYQTGMHLTNNPHEERKLLETVGVEVLLDDSSRAITHLAQSLHQKCAVVDGRVAFVGGVDLTRHEGGDYDRWDTHTHACSSDERTTSPTAPAHPWHDIHTRLEGPIVGDVERNIMQRWNSVAARHRVQVWPERVGAEVAQAAGVPAQIVRTIPPKTYPFARRGVSAIYQAYLRAIASASKYVYLETQYLWMDVFAGLDNTLWAGRDKRMKRLLDTLASALDQRVRVALILPDHPNCGREFSDAAVTYVREQVSEAGRERFSVFTLGNSEQGEKGSTRYRPVYVHAKLAIVDDRWWTVGSANLNSRGMHADAEMNVATLDPAGARTLRLRLWQEHAQPQVEDVPRLNDPIEGLKLLRERARANFERVRRKESIVGHLLPYITHREARAWNITHDREHGWLDTLDGGAGALPERYAARYL
jgi:phosphatidylserine/phosphatidylglycerophosphate/cardiolipin synthase-like enzyme